MSTASLVPLVRRTSIKLSPCSMPMAMMPPLRHVGKILQRGFLHRALLGGEEDEVLFGLPRGVVALVGSLLRLDADERGDFLAGAHLEQVRDGAALGGAGTMSGISCTRST